MTNLLFRLGSIETTKSGRAVVVGKFWCGVAADTAVAAAVAVSSFGGMVVVGEWANGLDSFLPVDRQGTSIQTQIPPPRVNYVLNTMTTLLTQPLGVVQAIGRFLPERTTANGRKPFQGETAELSGLINLLAVCFQPRDSRTILTCGLGWVTQYLA